MNPVWVHNEPRLGDPTPWSTDNPINKRDLLPSTRLCTFEDTIETLNRSDMGTILESIQVLDFVLEGDLEGGLTGTLIGGIPLGDNVRTTGLFNQLTNRELIHLFTLGFVKEFHSPLT
jgi:hypothetical protein